MLESTLDLSFSAVTSETDVITLNNIKSIKWKQVKKVKL